MAAFGEFGFLSYEDGVLTIGLAPPVDVTGWTMQTQVMKRFGGTPIITRSMASGYYGVSGMNIVNSGEGIVNAQIHSADMSGYDPVNYAVQVTRMDSGLHTVSWQGYWMLGVANP